MTKSWAEALGVVTAAKEDLPAPSPPAPAWGGAATTSGSEKAARDSANPLPFEYALQEALSELNVTSPGKEMKKRCVFLYGEMRSVVVAL